MEHGEVDQSVGRHEEVGEEAGDVVEVPDEDADEADGEHGDVGAEGVVVAAVAHAEGLEAGEDLVLGERLQHARRPLQAGDGAGERGGETARVYEGPPGTDNLHHLKHGP